MVAVGVGFEPKVDGGARGKYEEELKRVGGSGGVGEGGLCCGGRVRLANEVERRADAEFRRGRVRTE